MKNIRYYLLSLALTVIEPLKPLVISKLPRVVHNPAAKLCVS